jgi:hypothetical protein
MMSNKWTAANEIYKPTIKQVDRSKMIYRTSNGFEAFVVGEHTSETENDCWLIEGNGVKSYVWKKTTKNSIKRVSSDYELKKFNHSIF